MTKRGILCVSVMTINAASGQSTNNAANATAAAAVPAAIPTPAPTTPSPASETGAQRPIVEILFGQLQQEVDGNNSTAAAEEAVTPTARPTDGTDAPSSSPSTSAPTGGPSVAPSTSSPTYPPSTSDPTLTPTSKPSLEPSMEPTKVGSSYPSATAFPSVSPSASFGPSSAPTESPTYSPSVSNGPSMEPSWTKLPTFSPTDLPSNSPVIAPSTAPSMTEEAAYSRQYIQRLLVSEPQSLDLTQVAHFQYVYEQYTDKFGYEAGEPQIVTESLVLSQQIGINSVRGASRRGIRHMFHVRRMVDCLFGRWFGESREEAEDGRDDELERQLETSTEKEDEDGDDEEEEVQQTGYPLTMRFTMRYSTRVGVLDISTYNDQFAAFVNSDLEKVAQDLALLGLPVVTAGDVLLLKDKNPPTMKPTTPPPVPLPTLQPTTASPTPVPTEPPTTEAPTDFPSDSPSEDPPIIDVEVVKNESFILGLSLGLAGAFIVMALTWLHVKRTEKRSKEDKKKKAAESNQGSDRGFPGGGGYGHNTPLGYGKDGSEDNMESGAASKSTIDLTPNEDEEDPRNEYYDQQHQYSHDVLSHQQEMGIVDDPQYGREHSQHHSEHSPAGHMGHYPAGMLQPLDQPPMMMPHPNYPAVAQSQPMAHQHNIRHGEQEFYSSEPVIQSTGGEIMDSIFAPAQQTISPESSVNYTNLFSLPYDENGESIKTPPGTLTRVNMPQVYQQRQQEMIMQQRQAQSMMQFPNVGIGGSPNNTLMIHNTSFSSGTDSDDIEEYDDEQYDPRLLDGSHDELDNYKNQDLETLRTAVEESVDGVEGMMSLAVTSALTEPDMDASLEMPWAGAGDNGSIEASCLCETYDWLKRHKEASQDSIDEYFQDILNRIVITVMFGMTSPLQAAQLVHSCATILGLDLLKELPGKTLIITGMRKTNDLAQGHNFIVKAFKPFGKIEEAAIAPNNRGFGFVRFVKPESVKRALKKYNEFEIDIQDVSVSIKTLKSERPR